MKAVLRILCGCEKTVEFGDRRTPEIKVATFSGAYRVLPNTMICTTDSTPFFRYRVFDFDYEDKNGVCYYTERETKLEGEV